MKIKFKLYDVEHRIWAEKYNNANNNIVIQPNKSILKFMSVDGSIGVDITVDERHRLAEHLAVGMVNQYFEFDFEQPMPANRLNTAL